MKLLLIHLLVWFLLSIAYFFALSEFLIYLFPPEIQGVHLWVGMLLAGLVAIFVLTLISYIICAFRKRTKKTLFTPISEK